MDGHFTVGKLALRLNVPEHAIRGLADRNRIPCFRAGTYRVFSALDLPEIREALVSAGYSPAPLESAMPGTVTA